MDHRTLRKPSPFLALTLLALGGLAASAPVTAQQRLVARGVLHTANPNTFRVIAGKGTTFTDVTALGLKVGLAPDGEERIAFCRPAFMDPVARLVNYTVVAVNPENNPVSASFLVPTTIWSMETPPDLLFAQKLASPTAATSRTFIDTFQKLLARGNEPTANLGFLLQGTQDFRFQSNGDVYFVVELAIPFTVRVRNFGPICPDPRTNPAPPTPQPITDFVMFWTSSLSGTALISVNNRQISQLPIRVTGQRVAETVLPRQQLVRGANPLVLTVLPDDLAAGQAPITTSVTLTIPDVICPFDPRLPRVFPPR